MAAADNDGDDFDPGGSPSGTRGGAPGARWPAERDGSRRGSFAAPGLGPVVAGRWSLIDLPAPVRSQIFFNMVGDLLCYSGANEVNVFLDTLRSVCREFRDQIDEECLTFSYDDTCGLGGGVIGDQQEIQTLNTAIQKHPRLKYFECLVRSTSKFRALLEDLQLPPGTKCSYVLEFRVSADEVRLLLQGFQVHRLSVIPEDPQATDDRRRITWSDALARSEPGLRTLCLRSSTEEIIKCFLAACPRLQSLQIVDSQLMNDPGIRATNLVSLSFTGVVTLPDEMFTKIIAGCRGLRSLYISKCHVSNITVALPNLELLSVTHCRQLTDQCASELVKEVNNPNLRFLDLTEDRALASPTIAHAGLEIVWLMHCPQLTDQAVTYLFQNCPALTAANLVQSSIESAFISAPSLRTLELTTSQKLTDTAVTLLLEHCPNLKFLDVGHCCGLLEPKFAHTLLETILLSFCVNLRESAIAGLLANCPSLRYVELAVCMFDMTRFQRECGPNCQVVVNFDF